MRHETRVESAPNDPSEVSAVWQPVVVDYSTSSQRLTRRMAYVGLVVCIVFVTLWVNAIVEERSGKRAPRVEPERAPAEWRAP